MWLWTWFPGFRVPVYRQGVFDMASPRVFRDVRAPVGVARAIYYVFCNVTVPGDRTFELQDTEDLPRTVQM